MTYPSRVVVDTNVLVVSNGKAPQASDQCVISALDFLEFAEGKAVVILDSSWSFIDEYERYCSYRGQPGAGDRFFLHLHRTQADPRRVQFVEINPDSHGSYVEVPPPLASFDPSDHKFIAAVVADNRRSTIVNCVDSDWRQAAHTLKDCGILVHELCGPST